MSLHHGRCKAEGVPETGAVRGDCASERQSDLTDYGLQGGGVLQEGTERMDSGLANHPALTSRTFWVTGPLHCVADYALLGPIVSPITWSVVLLPVPGALSLIYS